MLSRVEHEKITSGPDVKSFLNERILDGLEEAAHLCDDYALTH